LSRGTVDLPEELRWFTEPRARARPPINRRQLPQEATRAILQIAKSGRIELKINSSDMINNPSVSQAIVYIAKTSAQRI